jgi:hypothetical protein
MTVHVAMCSHGDANAWSVRVEGRLPALCGRSLDAGCELLWARLVLSLCLRLALLLCLRLSYLNDAGSRPGGRVTFICWPK